ncbi:MAG: hypothetical protein Kow0099_25800 [Candidatus Abyssubacteria bacterium]
MATREPISQYIKRPPRHFIVESKDEYREAMEANLRELTEKIEKLKVKEATAPDHGIAEIYREQIEGLRKSRMTLRGALQEIDIATDEEWKTLRAGWDKLLREVQQTLDRFAASF